MFTSVGVFSGFVVIFLGSVGSSLTLTVAVHQNHPTKTHVVDSEPNTSVSHLVFLLKYPDFWAAGLSIWDLFSTIL